VARAAHRYAGLRRGEPGLFKNTRMTARSFPMGARPPDPTACSGIARGGKEARREARRLSQERQADSSSPQGRERLECADCSAARGANAPVIAELLAAGAASLRAIADGFVL
jgi:hypothetical protein